MRALVVYDTNFGNTAGIARAVADGLGAGAVAKPVAEVSAPEAFDLDLLVVGSPTNGGRPTPRMTDFLRLLPTGSLKLVRGAAFDTRMAADDQGFALRTLMGIIGYAAQRIEKSLVRAGAAVVASPEGFIVEGREGPLRSGEIERAVAWGRSLAPV
jgi:flavodoxin